MEKLTTRKPLIDLETNVLLIRIAAVLLVIQNAFFLYGLYELSSRLSNAGSLDEFDQAATLLSASLILDLLGFLVLGVAFILYSQHSQESNLRFFLLGGGVAIILFVFLRIIWQYLLASGSLLNVLAKGSQVVFLFILAELFLSMAFILLWIAFRGVDGLLMMVYGSLNLLSTLLMLPVFNAGTIVKISEIDAIVQRNLVGILAKLFIVPMFGIIVFLVLLFKSQRLLSSS